MQFILLWWWRNSRWRRQINVKFFFFFKFYLKAQLKSLFIRTFNSGDCFFANYLCFLFQIWLYCVRSMLFYRIMRFNDGFLACLLLWLWDLLYLCGIFVSCELWVLYCVRYLTYNGIFLHKLFVWLFIFLER